MQSFQNRITVQAVRVSLCKLQTGCLEGLFIDDALWLAIVYFDYLHSETPETSLKGQISSHWRMTGFLNWKSGVSEIWLDSWRWATSSVTNLPGWARRLLHYQRDGEAWQTLPVWMLTMGSCILKDALLDWFEIILPPLTSPLRQ